MSAPTSVLTFEDLIIEVARKLGYASYGEDGTEAAQVPTDAHDLDECERHVNNGIRMFINDAPVAGWRWTRPVQSLDLFTPVSEDDDNTVVSVDHDSETDRTTVIVEADTFTASMEEKSVEFESGTFTVHSVTSSTEIVVRGDASGVVGDKLAVPSNGNFTLPRDFGGQFIGEITYEAETDRGVAIDWISEGQIRKWRENLTVETGTPYWAAVRQMRTGDPRRRWELMVYPQPDEDFTVEFAYHLHFDRLVDLDEVHPAPFTFDEAIKAACLAVAEKDDEDMPGPNWKYYSQVALPAAHRADARSAPSKLGYFHNPGAIRGPASITEFRHRLYQRPNVTFNE